MVQQILVGIVFLAALGFLVSVMLRSFRAKEGCASGCGKCSADSTIIPSKATPKP